MTYTPRDQPRPLSAAAAARLNARQEAERRRDTLYDEATALLLPYAFAGQVPPREITAQIAALQEAARTVEIPNYL